MKTRIIQNEPEETASTPQVLFKRPMLALDDGSTDDGASL